MFCSRVSRYWTGMLVLILSFVSVESSAQITLKGEDMTVLQAITKIQEATDYGFFYNQKDLVGIPTRDINASGSLQDILKTLFSGTSISYLVQGKEIILKKEAEKKNPTVTVDEKRIVKGVILDEVDNVPLIGATVLEKGTDNVAVTDLNGNFHLDGCTNKTLLEISYIGYKAREIRVGTSGFLSISLSSANELETVVVVGAGYQKKVSVTGAIAAIKGNDLKTPSSSLTNNLAGKLAGIIAVTNSGEPGSTSQFYIRGISTFGGRTTPLILLDGVEIHANDLNNLPPESIESFSILKDASATAIYGARGANGVMLVTTKSGMENTKSQINVSVEQSFLQPVKMVDFADGATFMNTYNEALLSRNPSAPIRYSAQQIENTKNHLNTYLYPDVDWYNLMFRTFTMSQRANVNIQGGGSAVTYYMNIQMNHDGGLLKIPRAYSFNNNYNRWLYTFQNNIGYKITPLTKLDLRMNAQISSMQSPDQESSNIFNEVFRCTPVGFPAFYPKNEEDNHIHFGSATLSAGRFYTNPYANMLNSYRQTRSNKLNVSLNLDQKFDFITEGLSLTALVNFNNWSQNHFTRLLTPFLYTVDTESLDNDNPEYYEQMRIQEGTEYISQSYIFRNSDNIFYLDAKLNYKRKFGKHDVSGMFMYMMREFINDVLPNRNQGFSGRFTYDYDNLYLAEFNFGYNGTERIQRKGRYEFFPAVSLGWVLSREKFWVPVSKVVDFLKVRTSYGLVGSDETGAMAGAAHFLYLNNVDMWGGGEFHSGYDGSYWNRGPYVNDYAVSNPHWERAKEFDVGLDANLFNQLNITFDYFHNKRDRILMKRASFPAIMGYGSAAPWANVGKVDNTGFEISVNWKKNFGKDFTVEARANYSYIKNKYTYVDEPDYPYVWQTATGKPLSRITGYYAEGLFKDEGDITTSADQSHFGSVIMPGDIKYRDINGDTKITSEDQITLSAYGDVPRIQYGFGISLQREGMDFSVFFNGSAKRNIMINNIRPFCADDYNDNNLMQWIADGHWQEGQDNSNAIYPRLGTLSIQTSNNMVPSSWWMRNGNFIRFKTLEIGYRFKWFRLYLSGNDIAVWSKFKYWDPELNYNTYPLQRTYNIGLQVTI